MRSPSLIPPELAEAASQGDVVPVVGDHLNVGDPCGLPTPEQLARLVATKLGEPGPAAVAPSDLPRLAAQYEAMRGRHALVELLRRALGSTMPQVSEELTLASRTASEALITTSVSYSAERALEAVAGSGFAVISDPLDASYAAGGRRPWLIKLAGCVSKPDSLVVSEDDVVRLTTAIDHLALIVKTILVTKTLVFCGYGFDDPMLTAIHGLLQSSRTHSRRRYLITQDTDEGREAVWTNRGYSVLKGPTADVLRMLLSHVHHEGRSLHTAPEVSGHRDSPFKFLDFYREEDQRIYFGRDDEAEVLASHVLVNPFTVFVGPSGAGKTSLVNAGLVPRLHHNGFDTITIRALAHPSQEILTAVGADDGSLDLRQALIDRLHDRPTVILIDQFEEFFLRIGQAAREEFIHRLYDCLTSRILKLHVVIVIREDFLHRLLELEPPMDDVFRSKFWLRPFTRRQARSFLTRTCDYFGIRVDDQLVDEVMPELGGEEIDPAQLQIVCHELYRSASRFDRHPGLYLDLYSQAGRTSGILANYLDSAMDEVAADRRSVAQSILKCMVSVDRTKTAMTSTEIGRDAIMKRLRVPPGVFETTMNDLVKARIIRPLQGRRDVYELAHDVMAARIWTWIEPDEIQVKYAQQILRQAMSNWQQMRILPQSSQWRVVAEHKDDMYLNSAEALLAIRVALDIDEDVDYWIRKAVSSGVDIWAELHDILGHADVESRRAVVSWLSRSADARRLALLREAADSPYPAIHRFARRVTGEWTAMTEEPDKFVAVPAGDFVFGTDDTRFEHAQPSHRVTVAEFEIQRYPVTNHEYWQFTRATGHRVPDHWKGDAPSESLTEHPVVQVTWFDSVAYCQWYASEMGALVRLPTAAEWEKAASWDAAAGVKRAWAWGDDFDPAKGNTRVGGPGRTTSVGAYSAAGGDSACGVSDMSGNTFDWVQDWWSHQYDPADNINPRGPRSGQHKCARGGSWAGSPEGASAVSNKYSLSPYSRNEYVGFRLVRVTRSEQS